MVNIENNTIIADAEMFIVPNPITVDESTVPLDSIRKGIILTGITNGLVADKCYPAVQVWIASEDLKCDNLNCGSGVYGEKERTTVGYLPSLIPVGLVADKKEGENVDIIFPKAVIASSENVDLKLHITLAQTKYRYKRFGTFEEVLRFLLED